VISSLHKGPKRFKDLRDDVKLSETTLSKIIDELDQIDFIKHQIVNEKYSGYGLTRKGESDYDQIFLLLDTLDKISNSGGKYLSGGVPYVGSNSVWPTISHLAVDKTIPHITKIIYKNFLLSIQKYFLEELVKNIKKNKIPLIEHKGTIVLGIELEYANLIRSIKDNSFKKWKNLWKEEDMISMFWLQDSIGK